MSPSPTLGRPAEALLFAGLAAAQHAAWRVPAERRRAVFAERLRQLLGPDRADRVMASALALFDQQPAAPAGFDDLPATAHFECCPRCLGLKATKHSIAPSGRLTLEPLRDPEWLERQLDRYDNDVRRIAERLKCCYQTVLSWVHKHGLSDRLRQAKQHDDVIAERHRAGQSPGTIAQALGLQADDVRRVLERLGLVRSAGSAAFGHHHFEREWWVERLVRRQMTAHACAREAGVRPQTALHFAKKFGLQEHTSRNDVRVTRRRASYKYPQLADPAQLKALMAKHGTWEGIALEVCGRRTSASNVRLWWFTHFGSPPASLKRGRPRSSASVTPGERVPHAQLDWWTERLNRGLTTWQLAGEAGLQESSAREYLRRFGAELLAQAYRNNTAAEKARRRAS